MILPYVTNLDIKIKKTFRFYLIKLEANGSEKVISSNNEVNITNTNDDISE